MPTKKYPIRNIPTAKTTSSRWPFGAKRGVRQSHWPTAKPCRQQRGPPIQSNGSVPICRLGREILPSQFNPFSRQNRHSRLAVTLINAKLAKIKRL